MEVVLILFLLLLISGYLINARSGQWQISAGYLWLLLTVHLLLTGVYFLYAALSTSDSIAYYNNSLAIVNWFEVFDTGTPFIKFLAWPLTGGIGLSYYSVMLCFSFIGFWGIVFFLLAARENITLPVAFRGLSLTELLFLLPNLHFWSSSLGKGSVIVFGLGMFTYGLSRFNRRFMWLISGGVLTFMVRPHILFVLLVAIVIGVLFTRSTILGIQKWFLAGVAVTVFFLISDQVSSMAETDPLNILNSSSLMHRAGELAKADSGVEIQDYNLFMKLFTFWFRPLFVDAQGGVGLVASFENILYLIMFFQIIQLGIREWKNWNGWFKILAFAFILGSIALAQVSGNLGVAMRQKAQLMPFFFILFLKARAGRS